MSALPGSVVTIGETMGLFYSDTPGSLAQATRMGVGIGGSESNVAIGLARLGVSSTWIGRVGNDSLGRRIVRELRAEGVTARVVTDMEAPTGLMIKEHQTPDA
ncbi:MAG: PfkB family carbohydrate kinase, partial [Microbacteriaceae bacterium]